MRTSRFLRFTPYQMLIAIDRATGAREYRLLKGVLARLQSTVIRTTIRHGEHWRRHQFSWINEWEELLRHIDTVEVTGIDPCDAAPDHWRHVHNRIAIGEKPRAYTVERHGAWLKRREIER